MIKFHPLLDASQPQTSLSNLRYSRKPLPLDYLVRLKVAERALAEGRLDEGERLCDWLENQDRRDAR